MDISDVSRAGFLAIRSLLQTPNLSHDELECALALSEALRHFPKESQPSAWRFTQSEVAAFLSLYPDIGVRFPTLKAFAQERFF